MYVSCERQKNLNQNSAEEERRNQSAESICQRTSFVTALAISQVHDVQQLQLPMRLMNEQSLVILKMSLKVANCMNSFHHIWNFLTSISSQLANYIHLATTASANWFPNIFFWIWKQNAVETLKRDLGKKKWNIQHSTYPGTSSSCGFTNCKDGDILSSV